METGERRVATEKTWMFPPVVGWTFDQVRDLEVPFDWELVDGVIAPRGETALWHNHVRGDLVSALTAAETGPYTAVSSQCVMVDEHNVLKPDLIVFDLRGLDVLADGVPPGGVADQGAGIRRSVTVAPPDRVSTRLSRAPRGLLPLRRSSGASYRNA